MTVSVSSAVEILGIERPNAARWLRRFLRRREAQTGARILVDVSGPGARRPAYGVDMVQLAAQCPELVREEAELAKTVRAALAPERRAIAKLVEQFGEMRMELTILTESVRRLRR
ncbi:MAG: hypothetical protein SangKO_086820 [Sandaracinaceae bacterium]